jgi:hypothetical protein
MTIEFWHNWWIPHFTILAHMYSIMFRLVNHDGILQKKLSFLWFNCDKTFCQHIRYASGAFRHFLVLPLFVGWQQFLLPSNSSMTVIMVCPWLNLYRLQGELSTKR